MRYINRLFHLLLLYTTREKLIKQTKHELQLIILPVLIWPLWVNYRYINWLPVHDRIKFKIATTTYKEIYRRNRPTGNPPYLANLVQWYTPCRTLWSASANLLSVTRCNISFGAWGCLTSVLAKLSQHSADIFHSAFATAYSDPSQRLWFVLDYGVF